MIGGDRDQQSSGCAVGGQTAQLGEAVRIILAEGERCADRGAHGDVRCGVRRIEGQDDEV
ncbi:hypothetical protein PDG61_20855 [Mycolicibacterium sp. BiH015]|nr:hypothetical protein [Mycolicibacterium sp. BiH015]MDA2893377.1 hypothetical protein [Mycolicibacterium sp. BiH015]